MTVALLEQGTDEFCLHEEAVSALARLGITNLTLARDEQTVAVVLEGWLFDPIASAPAAADALATKNHTRMLEPVMHLAVSATAHIKEADDAHTEP